MLRLYVWVCVYIVYTLAYADAHKYICIIYQAEICNVEACMHSQSGVLSRESCVMRRESRGMSHRKRSHVSYRDESCLT